MTALVLVDGFDKYGPAGNQNQAAVMLGDWSISGTNFNIVAPLTTLGYALNIGSSSAVLTGTLPAAMTRISGSFRFSFVAAQAIRVFFLNGATAAFSINGNASGAIELRTGNNTGAVVASGGSIALNIPRVLSFDVTIGAAGAYAFYLDGVSIFSGTGNTGNGQASINTVQLTAFASCTYDDLCLFNPADAAYNASVLTSNVLVETSFPNGDAQKQFTNDGNVVWPAGIAAAGVYSATATTNAPGANQIFLVKITPPAACTLNSVSLIPRASSGVAKFRAVAYADSSGSPGTLLSSGTEVTATTSGTTLTGALTTPQALTAGTSYWIGFITDTSIVLGQVDATTILGRKQANTYTSGAPAGPLASMTTGQATWQIWGNCTGASVNWPAAALNPPLGTAQSQSHSATVAQEDLYTFAPLVSTPSAIYGVAVKGLLTKSDSGARTVSLNMKSGSSDSAGSAASQAMLTTTQWQRSYFDADPATGVAWTGTGLNAASSGLSVAS